MGKDYENLSTEELIKILVERMGYAFSSEDINPAKSKEIEEVENKKIKNYIEGFDEEFDTNMRNRIKETPMLLSLFREFIQGIYKPNDIYTIALKTKGKLKDELSKNFTEEQKSLLEQIEFCEDRILDDMVEQAFIYGYAMSSELREEAVKKYSHKK